MQIAITEDNIDTQSRISALAGAAYPQANIAKFGNLAESLQYVHAHRVECWLVDLGLPDGTGLDLIRSIHLLQPQCNVMVISVFEEPTAIINALREGAKGYIVKNALEHDLRDAMQAMFDGGTPLSPVIASRLLAQMLPQATAQPDHTTKQASHNADDATLTAKEAELLNLLSRGYSYSEAADLMHLRLGTIQTHIKHIYTKLHVNSKTQAIFEAQSLGMIK